MKDFPMFRVIYYKAVFFYSLFIEVFLFIGWRTRFLLPAPYSESLKKQKQKCMEKLSYMYFEGPRQKLNMSIIFD